jgi:hypothetical protein
MKVKTHINHQQGVVLIFSLVMLLLLTLVSVNMIQANQLELAMTANALEQTKELARAETYLAQAEEKIKKRRVATSSNSIPLNSIPLPPGWCLSNLASKWEKNIDLENKNVTATITGFYCLNDFIETECVRDNSAPTATNTTACKCDRDNEIYTIKLTTHIDSGTQRTIESKYSVNCTLGQRKNLI